jgi:hypothetical protein
MMMHHRLILAAVLMSVGLGSASACSRAARTAASPILGDTLRGIVQIVGSEPGAVVQLRLGTGRVLRLESREPGPLRAASNLDVMVRGGVTATGDGFRVDQFVVRTVDGLPAVDGWLVSLGGGNYALRGTDGTQRPLSGVPANMASLVGARIYWVGPLDQAPAGYGVLAR